MFAMCSATDSFDIALASQEIDICELCLMVISHQIINLDLIIQKLLLLKTLF